MRKWLFFVFASFVLLNAGTLAYPATRWYVGGANGNWSTAGNWNGGTVPATTDDVVIGQNGLLYPGSTNGPVVLDTARTANSLTVIAAGK